MLIVITVMMVVISLEQLDNSISIYSFYINGVLNTNPQPLDTVFDNLSVEHMVFLSQTMEIVL